MWATGVSGAMGVVALAVAAALWVFAARERGRLWFQILVVCLVLTGVAGVMVTFVGDWIRTGTGWAESAFGAIGGKIGVPIGLGVVAIVLLIHVVAKVVDRSVDDRVLLSTAGLSITAGAIPGAVGALAMTVIGIPIHLTAALLAAGFGL